MKWFLVIYLQLTQQPTFITTQMSLPQAGFVDIKHLIASSYPDFEARATTAWHEIIKELDKLANVIKEEGVNVSS